MDIIINHTNDRDNDYGGALDLDDNGNNTDNSDDDEEIEFEAPDINNTNQYRLWLEYMLHPGSIKPKSIPNNKHILHNDNFPENTVHGVRLVIYLTKMCFPDDKHKLKQNVIRYILTASGPAKFNYANQISDICQKELGKPLLELLITHKCGQQTVVSCLDMIITLCNLPNQQFPQVLSTFLCNQKDNAIVTLRDNWHNSPYAVSIPWLIHELITYEQDESNIVRAAQVIILLSDEKQAKQNLLQYLSQYDKQTFSKHFSRLSKKWMKRFNQDLRDACVEYIKSQIPSYGVYHQEVQNWLSKYDSGRLSSTNTPKSIQSLPPPTQTAIALVMLSILHKAKK
jgi:hypothetical protein